MQKHLTFSVEQWLKHLNSRSACEKTKQSKKKKKFSMAVVPVNKKQTQLAPTERRLEGDSLKSWLDTQVRTYLLAWKWGRSLWNQRSAECDWINNGWKLERGKCPFRHPFQFPVGKSRRLLSYSRSKSWGSELNIHVKRWTDIWRNCLYVWLKSVAVISRKETVKYVCAVKICISLP